MLWRDNTSMAGVLTVAVRHYLGAHAHRLHHHHIWVLDGHATILGVDAVGLGSTVGCTAALAASPPSIEPRRFAEMTELMQHSPPHARPAQM